MLTRRRIGRWTVILLGFTTVVLSPMGLFAQDTLDEDVPDGFTLIEAGTFTMGSPASEAGRDNVETQHQVSITRNFYMQVHEVTQEEWRELMGNNPSYFPSCGGDCPVENVTWYDAVAYANALSRAERLDECFELSDCASRAGEGMDCASVTFAGLDCEGYRLPTEAEWEYAARAGTTTAFYTGSITETECDLDPNLDEIGWYCGNADGMTHQVGQKSPNDWGLYDMSGNVQEWVWDWWVLRYYNSSPPGDPLGPSSGWDRVVRGGCWLDEAWIARVADRSGYTPHLSFYCLGFRLARSVH